MTDDSTQRDITDRRPLKSRGREWATRLADWLAGSGISPNQISLFSVVFAVLSLVLLWLSSHTDSGVRALCLVLAAILCQLRLLCNLMDGMVAIEGGKKTLDGPLWNEMPDRVADVAILVGFGVAAEAIVSGWAAASIALTIAYLRELGKGIDGHIDFGGPMAKPQRMALVTLVLLLAAATITVLSSPAAERYGTLVLQAGLGICIAGSLITVWRRTHHIQRRLLRH